MLELLIREAALLASNAIVVRDLDLAFQEVSGLRLGIATHTFADEASLQRFVDDGRRALLPLPLDSFHYVDALKLAESINSTTLAGVAGLARRGLVATSVLVGDGSMLTAVEWQRDDADTPMELLRGRAYAPTLVREQAVGTQVRPPRELAALLASRVRAADASRSDNELVVYLVNYSVNFDSGDVEVLTCERARVADVLGASPTRTYLSDALVELARDADPTRVVLVSAVAKNDEYGAAAWTIKRGVQS